LNKYRGKKCDNVIDRLDQLTRIEYPLIVSSYQKFFATEVKKGDVMKTLLIVMSICVATLLIGAMASGAFTNRPKQDQSAEQKTKKESKQDLSEEEYKKLLAEHRIEKEDGETKIKYFVRKAKILGQTKIVIHGPIDVPEIIPTLDEALSRYSVIIGRPMQKTSLINDDESGISTFYKLKIVEVLSKSDKKPCCKNYIKLPSQLAEPVTGQIYLYSAGGIVTVDGIEITQREWTDELKLDHDYLLFLSQNLSEKVNTVNLGREVLYEIGSDGIIDTRSKQPNIITDQIRNIHSNSTNLLRSYIKTKQN
jgi:hypothetical protein